MRLVFGPDDHEEYQAVRERVASLVVDWARRRDVPVQPALVAAALDHRHGVDGRLGRWTRAHVADALAVWFPRTVALLDDDRDAVPAALHALIAYLADHKNQAPPNEQAFREYLGTKEDNLRKSGISIDAMFTSPRDGEPLVWVYGRKPPAGPAGMTYLGYEKTPVDGKRLVIATRGMYDQIDETQFRKLFPKTP